MTRALVAQGGGPTAVINQSLAGVVLEARRFSNIEAVYGACNGVAGILTEDLVDLGQETTQQLELVAATSGSALGSTRDKPDIKYCQEILRVLQGHGTSYFFYIGGNDTADTLRIVSDEARKAGYPLRCIHVPKTIDNDLMCNDHTPGFPSAARFVTRSFHRCQSRQRSPTRCLPRGCHGRTCRLLDRSCAGRSRRLPATVGRQHERLSNLHGQCLATGCPPPPAAAQGQMRSPAPGQRRRLAAGRPAHSAAREGGVTRVLHNRRRRAGYDFGQASGCAVHTNTRTTRLQIEEPALALESSAIPNQ